MDILPRSIPTSSGVYFFASKGKKPLYIGKATNLRQRLRSYFSRQTSERITQMVQESERLSWQETGSDIEALLLESKLIKHYQPKYNIMLRDDKQYFYVVIDEHNEFPKVIITHQPNKTNKNNKYALQTIIGPFTSGVALKTTLRAFRNIFPYCTCTRNHARACLNGHIGRCLGFCCLKDTPTKAQQMIYRKNIAHLKELLRGRKSMVINKLQKRMAEEAQKGNFDIAIILRQKIEKMNRIFLHASIIADHENTTNDNKQLMRSLQDLVGTANHIDQIEGYDSAHIQGDLAAGALVVFKDFKPETDSYRKFSLQQHTSADDISMLKEIISRRIKHPEWPYPDLILVDGGRNQLEAALSILKENNIVIPVIALTKDDRHRAHKVITKKNGKLFQQPLQKLKRDLAHLLTNIDAEAHRFAIQYYRKMHRKIVQTAIL